MAPLDPRRLLDVLTRNNVDFILVGAVAAIAQGYPLNTKDIDITPSRTPDNLERLTTALRELDAPALPPGDLGLRARDAAAELGLGQPCASTSVANDVCA